MASHKVLTALIPAVLALTCLAGCGEHEHAHNGEHAEHEDHDSHAGHDHEGHDHDSHEGHDHETAHADHEDHAGHEHSTHQGEAPAEAIGDVTVAGVTYGVSTHGAIKAGAEGIITVTVEQGSGATELRTWVGVENGRGSTKALLKANAQGNFHGHLEVPATLTDDSALWIEVVTDTGRERASVKLKP